MEILEWGGRGVPVVRESYQGEYAERLAKWKEKKEARDAIDLALKQICEENGHQNIDIGNRMTRCRICKIMYKNGEHIGYAALEHPDLLPPLNMLPFIPKNEEGK